MTDDDIEFVLQCYICQEYSEPYTDKEPEGWKHVNRGFLGKVHICPDCIKNKRKYRGDTEKAESSVQIPSVDLVSPSKNIEITVDEWINIQNAMYSTLQKCGCNSVSNRFLRMAFDAGCKELGINLTTKEPK
jgi:hypothetical protein